MKRKASSQTERQIKDKLKIKQLDKGKHSRTLNENLPAKKNKGATTICVNLAKKGCYNHSNLSTSSRANLAETVLVVATTFYSNNSKVKKFNKIISQ